ncbi:MAG TPA: YceI family protein [Burkholderiaceae bacterium]
MQCKHLIAALLAAATVPAFAQTYNIDPGHTFPSFEIAHNGISVFRGKFTKTTGKIVLDRTAKTGSVDIAIDPKSFDIGHAKLNAHVMSADMLNVEKFNNITYKGTFSKFDGANPTAVAGELTMMGVTKPVALTINSLKCIIHPSMKREVCGADVSGEFNRTDFGLTYGPAHGSVIKLAIQVEAPKAD